MSFDEIYENVPSEQKDALKTFREQYPLKTIPVDNIDWTYHTAGSGEKTILWLVGGLKKADAACQTIPLLVDSYHIIAPDYPALLTMKDLADGLAAICEAENAESVYVLAGSFGGMLAQVFLREYPDTVSKIILSTTTAPDKNHIERYQQLLDMAKLAPENLLKETAQSQMFGTIAPPDSEADFYRAYLKELYEQRLSKADIVSIYEAIIDYMGRDFSADDLVNWEGKMLIINSDNDATFGPEVQDSLSGLYPRATIHTFEGAGHSPGSTRRDEFFALVRNFFDR